MNSRTALSSRVAAAMGDSVEGGLRFVWTGNRVRLVSVRRKGTVMTIRLSERLLDLPLEVGEEIGALARRVPGAAAALRRRFQDLGPTPSTRPVPGVSEGRVHDLQAILDAVWTGSEPCPVRIQWSRSRTRSVRKRRRSIQLGSYRGAHELVRIHPVLDQVGVPLWFVAFIVFHELLHHEIGVSVGPTGRRRIHPPEFRALERAHPRYRDAMDWERRNLRYLLRGIPVPQVLL